MREHAKAALSGEAAPPAEAAPPRHNQPEPSMPEILERASTLARDLAIASVRSTIVDVPTVRRHKLSQTSVTAQSYVLVQVRLGNGAEGIGEAATLGGPRWSEESVEAMKANIDAYLAPAVVGSARDLFEAAGVRMDAGGEAQQRRQGRGRDGAVRRGGQDASACPPPRCSAARCGTACRCSGRSPPATRRRRWRRPRASSRHACTAPSR